MKHIITKHYIYAIFLLNLLSLVSGRCKGRTGNSGGTPGTPVVSSSPVVNQGAEADHVGSTGVRDARNEEEVGDEAQIVDVQEISEWYNGIKGYDSNSHNTGVYKVVGLGLLSVDEDKEKRIAKNTKIVGSLGLIQLPDIFDTPIMVNAANDQLETGWSGLNRGITRLVGLNDNQGWTDLDDTRAIKRENSNTYEAGGFGISEENFKTTSNTNHGITIYHAIGPRRSKYCIKRTDVVQNYGIPKICIKNLFYKMLKKASEISPDKKCIIVLYEVSTSIYAEDSRRNIDNEYVNKMREGMREGLYKFIKEKTSSNLIIILANWGELNQR